MFAARQLRRVPLEPVESPSDAGFTVLEILVSIVIFAIVASSATLAIVNGIKTTNSSNNRVTATSLAQAALTKARADMTSLMATPTATTTSGAYTIARSATIPVSNGVQCPVGQEMPITVTVTWKQGGTRSVRIDSAIAC